MLSKRESKLIQRKRTSFLSDFIYKTLFLLSFLECNDIILNYLKLMKDSKLLMNRAKKY